MEAATLDQAVHVKALQKDTLEHLRQNTRERDVLLKTAQTLGIDGTLLARYEGTVSGGRMTGGGTRRTRTRRTSGTTNGTFTTETLLAGLREHGPMNQSQLAAMFGVTRQTIAKRLKDAGPQVIKQGKGAQMKWRARAQAPASA